MANFLVPATVFQPRARYEAASNQIRFGYQSLVALAGGENGSFSSRHFKRVQMFVYEDIEVLRVVIAKFPELATTPHILSETSNFVDQSPSWRHAELAAQLKAFICEVGEIYHPAESLIEREEFNALGLSDTAMAELSSEMMVVTTDYKLSQRIQSRGGSAINFNHLRTSFLAAQ